MTNQANTRHLRFRSGSRFFTPPSSIEVPSGVTSSPRTLVPEDKGIGVKILRRVPGVPQVGGGRDESVWKRNPTPIDPSPPLPVFDLKRRSTS